MSTDATPTHRLVLRPPTPEDEAAARSAHAALAAEDFAFMLGGGPQPWDVCLENLRVEREERDLPPGRVRHTFALGWVADHLVGRVSIRHDLTPELLRVGGHVGYGVVPSHRGRGHATRMLHLALGVLADEGLASALVTCDEGNTASEATIRRAGGVLEDAVDTGEGPRKLRFWVPTPSPTPAQPARDGVTVRDVTDADLHAMAHGLQGGAAHAYHREHARLGRRDHLVAVDPDGVPVGSAHIRWGGFGQEDERAAAPHVPEIAAVQVHPTHRSRGIGSALLAEAERRIARYGHPTAGLGVGLDNPRARALYERRGYRDTGHRSEITYRYTDDEGVAREATETNAILIRPSSHE